MYIQSYNQDPSFFVLPVIAKTMLIKTSRNKGPLFKTRIESYVKPERRTRRSCWATGDTSLQGWSGDLAKSSAPAPLFPIIFYHKELKMSGQTGRRTSISARAEDHELVSSWLKQSSCSLCLEQPCLQGVPTDQGARAKRLPRVGEKDTKKGVTHSNYLSIPRLKMRQLRPREASEFPQGSNDEARI